jgi:hypothetical protein
VVSSCRAEPNPATRPPCCPLVSPIPCPAPLCAFSQVDVFLSSPLTAHQLLPCRSGLLPGLARPQVQFGPLHLSRLLRRYVPGLSAPMRRPQVHPRAVRDPHFPAALAFQACRLNHNPRAIFYARAMPLRVTLVICPTPRMISLSAHSTKRDIRQDFARSGCRSETLVTVRYVFRKSSEGCRRSSEFKVFSRSS